MELPPPKRQVGSSNPPVPTTHKSNKVRPVPSSHAPIKISYEHQRPTPLTRFCMASIKFNLNGKPQTVDAVPEMPLLWVLRDTLSMTGTKFGCGMAMCGACAVHINGDAVRSCITQIQSVAGKSVTTIEGLSADGSHPVQVAWIENDVPQCGYCQS